jgi:hypothetical protein
MIALTVAAAISSSQAEGVLSGISNLLVKSLAWPAAVVLAITSSETQFQDKLVSPKIHYGMACE